MGQNWWKYIGVLEIIARNQKSRTNNDKKQNSAQTNIQKAPKQQTRTHNDQTRCNMQRRYVHWTMNVEIIWSNSYQTILRMACEAPIPQGTPTNSEHGWMPHGSQKHSEQQRDAELITTAKQNGREMSSQKRHQTTELITITTEGNMHNKVRGADHGNYKRITQLQHPR